MGGILAQEFQRMGVVQIHRLADVDDPQLALQEATGIQATVSKTRLSLTVHRSTCRGKGVAGEMPAQTTHQVPQAWLT